MNQDSFFAIGRTHRICQDYAICGSKNQLPYIVVSDGCSSSKDTDFGSRFLCKGIEGLIYGPYDIDEYDSVIACAYDNAKNYVKIIHELTEECLDATLLFAKVYNGFIKVVVTGDGVIAAKRKDGVIVAKSIRYQDNAPVYLSYYDNPERRDRLIKTYNCTKTITTQFIGTGLPITKEISNEDTEVLHFPASEFSHISIMTDGIESFERLIQNGTTKTSESVPLEELLPDLMSYKNDVGAFIQRRCQKFMKQCGDNGIYHNDDFSIATISI